MPDGDPQGQHESQGIQDAVVILPSARFAAHGVRIKATAEKNAQPRMAVPQNSGLDAIGNGGLHAIEEEEAAEGDEGDGKGGGEKEQAGSLAAAGDGPAETVNDTGHGVEAVKPAPALRHQRACIRHRRSKHPELDEERNDVANVAIEGVERREPQADAESREERESEKRRQPESGESGENAVGETENRQDHKADSEVHQAGKSGGNGKNEAREINLGDEALVVHHNVGGHLESVGEVGPGDEGGEIKDGSRKALGRELGEAAEKESENQHGEDGLNNHPEDANDGWLVADFDVAPDEKVEQFAIGPDFAEAKFEEAARRFDANGGGGAGVERNGGGLRDGGHACSSKKLLRADEALIRVPKKTQEEAETKEKTETGKLKIEKDVGRALPLQKNYGGA